jgi:SAM-dependent methyltransferase
MNKENELDLQIKYWNKVAYEKSFTHPVKFDRLHELLPEYAKILDYGCGYGRTCADFTAQGFLHVTGVDVSPEMIRRGNSLFPDLELRHVAPGPLAFEAGTFDACILFGILTCIPTDKGQLQLIGDIHRILKPGGILYISDYPIQNDERNQRRYRKFQHEYGKFGVFRIPEGAIFRHHDLNWIQELLSNFKILTIDRFKGFTMNKHEAELFQVLARVQPFEQE